MVLTGLTGYQKVASVMYVISEGSTMLVTGRLMEDDCSINLSPIPLPTSEQWYDYANYNRWSYDFIWQIFLQEMSCFQDIPVQVGSGFKSEFVRFMKPQMIPFDWADDYHQFGSPIHLIPQALALVGDALSGYTPPNVHLSEKQVTHTTAPGTYLAPGGSWYGSIDDSFRWSNDVPTKVWSAYRAPKVFNADRSVNVDANQLSTWYCTLDPDEYLGNVQTYLQNHPHAGGSPHLPSTSEWRFMHVNDFSFSYSPHLLTIHYSQHICYEQQWNGGRTFFDVSTTLRVEKVDYVDPSGNLIVGLLTREDVLSGKLQPDSGKYTNPPEAWIGADQTRTFKGYVRAACHHSHASMNSPMLKAKAVQKVQRLDSVINWLMPEIRKSAYVSAGDALKDYESVIQSNYFESISELGEILSLVPDLSVLNDAIRLVGAGNIITGALTFVDAIASFYLLYQFGLRPAADDYYQLATRLDDLARRLKNRSENVEVRGKFTYTFPDGDPLSGSKLVTRTKIVFRVPKHSILAMMISFKSGGFDFSPGSAWDLVPFSFVVDWFANLGERMDMGFNNLRFLSVEMSHCVHSFTVYTPVESDSDFTVSPDSHVKHYERLVSEMLPCPREGRYDFLAVQKKPPLASAGSLLWTLLR